VLGNLMQRNSPCLKNTHTAKYTLDSAPLSGPFWTMKRVYALGVTLMAD
jgi:hypothetical protein